MAKIPVSASKSGPEPLKPKELPDLIQKSAKAWIDRLGTADAKQLVADEMRKQADLIAKPLPGKRSGIVWAGN